MDRAEMPPGGELGSASGSGGSHYTMDHSNTAGGGFGHFSFFNHPNPDASSSTVSHGLGNYAEGLPPQPGSFEGGGTMDAGEVSESRHVDFDLTSFVYPSFFPSIQPGSPSLYGVSTNPFSPNALSPPQVPSALPPPAGSMSQPGPPPGEPQPLFDATESSLFSTFLNTLDSGDQNFLFDPVVPDGIPSPPPSRMLTAEERGVREGLGRAVGGLDLGGGARREVDVPENAMESEEGSYDDDPSEEDGTGGAEEDGNNSNNNNPPSASKKNPRTSTKSTAGGGGGGASQSRTNKKPKMDLTSARDVAAALNRAAPGDVEMAPPPTSLAKERRSSSTSRTPSNRKRRPSKVAAAALAAQTAGSSGSATPSSSGGARIKRSTTSTSIADSAVTAHPPPPLSIKQEPPTDSSPIDDDDAEGEIDQEQEQEDEDSSPDSPSDGQSPSKGSKFTTGGGGGDGGKDRKTPLTESQKRSNHILSEQKRRNAIRSGFKDLVDLLQAGEAMSGVVVAGGMDEGDSTTGKKAGGSGTGRGRGRKGDAGAGASKSVVLDKAASYILWLERGNQGLLDEVKRVEGVLGV
ncbi:hypothetical protein T439DRAFT_350699 [Meredithblackwellia eburnea MCA 4105]